MKKIIIIAGPNGAGKTTFAENFLTAEANLHIFINADWIAARLSPLNPDAAAIKAGREMLQEIEACVAQGISFSFETTLSGISYLRRIKQWQQLGYEVKLWFLSLPSAEIAVARVALRVLQGGHYVPEQIIRRRFNSGLFNFWRKYKMLVDSWVFYDNSGITPLPIDWLNKCQ